MENGRELELYDLGKMLEGDGEKCTEQGKKKGLNPRGDL